MQRILLYCFALILPFAVISAQSPVFLVDSSNVNPWTKRGFENKPADFQFAIVKDRTGGHRDGVFEKAVEKLKLHPEFVMCMGDLIEGYTKDQKEIDRQKYLVEACRCRAPVAIHPGRL